MGFSNGAAAAFLLATHLVHAQHISPTARRLRFVILAGGYVPDPLSSLVADASLVENEQGGPGSWLRAPLPLPSLHCVGACDACIPPASSEQLARAFDAASGRVVHRHTGGHYVPQRSADRFFLVLPQGY
jgi:predicted esterase